MIMIHDFATATPTSPPATRTYLVLVRRTPVHYRRPTESRNTRQCYLYIEGRRGSLYRNQVAGRSTLESAAGMACKHFGPRCAGRLRPVREGREAVYRAIRSPGSTMCGPEAWDLFRFIAV